MELQEQVQAYTAWVNSQLKKRSQKVQDLGKDLQDGTALISVIEIVSGHQLEAILSPTNDDQKKQNVVKVIDFMKQNGIKLHHVSPEEIVAGNVKTMMQLILALAAHFKPASIGGRKHVESTHPVAPARTKHRWKQSKEHTSLLTRQHNSIKDLDVETDLTEIQQLAQKLQQMLLQDAEGEPISGCNAEENLVIVRAQLDQVTGVKDNVEKEISSLSQTCRQLTANNSALETRLKQQEEELLSLRQQLLRTNLEKDKLSSEKAELLDEVQESRRECNLFRSKLREKELAFDRLENDIMFMKSDHSRAMSKKDKELSTLQQQLRGTSPMADSVFLDSRLCLSQSPVLKQAPRSPVLRRSPNSPTLERRTPVSRHNPRRRKTTSDNASTRILYFTDRDMTPAMTTIAKRVGDITLGEFKNAIKKHGNYRFIFKALDPELGTVKEEVFNDDDIIPGWEGKVVAWVEEELRV